MSFKSTNLAFTNRALSHFKGFIQDFKLFSPTDGLLIAISGGIDSMVLGYLLCELKRYGYSNKIRFIYINHNTRPGQMQEQDLVKAFAQHLGVSFLSKTLDGLDVTRNFEHNARMARYKMMQECLEDDELLLFAHHVDDSYEWSILQGLRSSNLNSLLGIPVINGKIRRPLMCFTKKHIKSIAAFFDLPYIKDPTNELIKYERNFLRHKIIKSFAIRHPKYLKHYVNQHNELARRLGLHVFLKTKALFKYKQQPHYVEIINFSSILDFSGLDELILKAVKHLKQNGRGNLHRQIEKIKIAMKNNKHGPLILSGGIKVFIDFNYLFIVDDRFQFPKKLTSFDKLFSLIEYLHFIQSQEKIPYFIEVDGIQKGFIFGKRIHPIWEQLPECFALEKARYINVTNLLRQWNKPKNKDKKLKLRFFLAD